MDLRFVRTFSHSFYYYGRQLPLPNESRVWDAHLFRHDLDDFRLFIGPLRYP